MVARNAKKERILCQIVIKQENLGKDTQILVKIVVLRYNFCLQAIEKLL
jgi:hypothetical protein